MIGRILGLGTAAREVGQAVGGVAEVFVGNRAARDAAGNERFNRVLAQFGEEFVRPAGGRFDGFVNGLNRLPRPMMALGTLVLFVYAMVDPPGFATRMQGLAYVPEPLWWLLGAVVSFYFGARELHHSRGRRFDLPPPPAAARDEASPPAPGSRSRQAGATAMPAPSLVPASATPAPVTAPTPATVTTPARTAPAAASAAPAVTDPDYNAAVEEWRRGA